jgi:hypothetical protein
MSENEKLSSDDDCMSVCKTNSKKPSMKADGTKESATSTEDCFDECNTYGDSIS